jgi:hypothetical protein
MLRSTLSGSFCRIGATASVWLIVHSRFAVRREGRFE